MELITVAILMNLGGAVGACIGLLLGERQSRKWVTEEMRTERNALKEALSQIAEHHNQLTTIQKVQGEALEDLTQRVSFLVQGVKK